MIDTIPLWAFWPILVVACITWLVVEVRSAVTDPHPEYSRLDRLDGLDSRTD